MKTFIIEEKFVGYADITIEAETEEEAIQIYKDGNYKDEYVDKTDYHNQPHEIEAFELEGIIYQNYLEEQYGVTPDEVSFFYSNRFPSRYTGNINKEVL